MNRCLDAEPQKRPNAKELVPILSQFRENINDRKTDLYKQIEEITTNFPTCYQTKLQFIYETH
ncbi:hypothetical protein C2G38_2104207, partial [Gigaspora rosea]